MIKKNVEAIRYFSSPTFGNVWPGRTLVVGHEQAKRLVSSGLAKLIDKGESYAGTSRRKAGGK